MEITWLGHSCLRVQSGDYILVTDPYGDSLGLSMGSVSADIVTTSHEHPHHANHAAVRGSPRVLRGPGEYEIGSFYIAGTGTRRGESAEDRTVNTVFTIRAEGLRLCHLGDILHPLPSRQVEELRNIDVLFVPAGGVCTMPVDKMAALINVISPRVVVPVHYRADGVKVELGPLDAFLRELGISEVPPVNRLNVTASNLPREMRIVVLQKA